MAQSNAAEAVAAEPVLPATGCRGWRWDMSWVLGEIQKYSGTCGMHHECSWMIWETNGIDGNGSGTIFPWVGLPCQAGNQVGTLIHRVFQHSKQRQKSILCMHTYTVIYLCVCIYIIEGSLEVKLPTIWTVEKQRWEESEEKKKIRREKIRRERVRRKKMQMREKVGKSRFTVFFQWFVAPEGRKVGSLKRRVRSQLARWEMKNCTPLWREAHFQVKMYKTHQCRTTFGSCDVEKVHAVVARSTFPSQKC